MPRGVPADIAARMNAMFARMDVRGQTESMEVWGEEITTNPATGEANGTQWVLLTTLDAHRLTEGGSAQRATEGMRVTGHLRLLFQPDASGSLTEANFGKRRVKLPAISGALWRITQCQGDGPYLWCDVEVGATSDARGQTR